MMHNGFQRIPKLLTLTTGIAALAGVVAILTISSKSQKSRFEDAPAKDRLRWHAKVAKANGQHEVTVPGLIVDHDGSASSLTTAEMLSYYSVVRAQPTNASSYAVDSNAIATWYKFKVLETFSHATKVTCPSCIDSDLPAELLPLERDEFLLWKAGGLLVIDGVNVTMSESGFPAFKLGQEYVLFVARRPSGVAEIGGGPIGTFILDQNGHLLPVAGGKHVVTKRLLSDLGDSLPQVKLNARKSQAEFNARFPARGV